MNKSSLKSLVRQTKSDRLSKNVGPSISPAVMMKICLKLKCNECKVCK